LIETTGLADPAPIIHTLMTDPVICNRYTLDGVITTVDAVNGDLQFDRHHESVKQAAVADRIVLTKCDLADDAQAALMERGLNHVNPGAPVYRAEHGEIDPDFLFNAGLYNPETKTADVRRWLRDEAYLDREHGHDHGHDHGHNHDHRHDLNRHDHAIRAYCVTEDEPLNWEVFVAWIRTLIARYGQELLRIKGIVNVAGQDAPIAIHGVQHLFHDPVQLSEWPDDDRRSRIVFITRDLDPELVEARLAELKQAAAAEKA
jgi:G3E family GTPase